MHYEDLLSELDVLALDSMALDDFGLDATAILTDKRRLSVEWVRRSLEREGLDPNKHITRHAPAKAFSHNGAAYTDVTGELGSLDGALDLASVFATPSTDSLFLAHSEPFAALYVGMLDEVNTLSSECVNSVTYWNGGKWAGVNSVADGTVVSASGAFSGGGRISWQLPVDIQRRPLNQSDYLYWVRLRVSLTPTAATNVLQILPVRRSRLTLPAAYHALALLYDDGDQRRRGEWVEKVERYQRKASELLTDAMAHARDEFDIDKSESVTAGEGNSVQAPPPFVMLRG